jgi:hypothetical protein
LKNAPPVDQAKAKAKARAQTQTIASFVLESTLEPDWHTIGEWTIRINHAVIYVSSEKPTEPYIMPQPSHEVILAVYKSYT